MTPNGGKFRHAMPCKQTFRNMYQFVSPLKPANFVVVVVVVVILKVYVPPKYHFVSFEAAAL